MHPNGLFSAPAAVYTILEGMRVHFMFILCLQEPGATFELNVELLQVVVT